MLLLLQLCAEKVTIKRKMKMQCSTNLVTLTIDQLEMQINGFKHQEFTNVVLRNLETHENNLN